MAKMTDFSVPQRMSPGALFIYFLKSFRFTFNAIIIYLIYDIFKNDGGLTDTLLEVAGMTGCAAALALIMAAMAFFKVKFHVAGGSLIYRHSLISRATTTIPLSRIHTLRTRRGVLYRLLGLRGVLFDTLAAKDEEVELILSEADWQSLLGRIERQEQPQPASADAPPAYNPSSVMTFGNENLVLDALCQNHLKGMVVMGSFAAMIFGQMSNLSKSDIDQMADYLESHLGDFAVSVAGVAMIMASAYVASLVLWLGKVILRYYNLSLRYDSKVLTFSHGLFSRMTSRFARDKICTLWVKRNFPERRLGLATLALKQALNSSAAVAEDNLKIYGRDTSDFFLRWWLGPDYAREAEIATARSGRGVMLRSLAPDLLLSAAASVALWHFGQYGWMLLPAIYLLAAIPKGILTMRHSHITLRESYLTVGKGRFAEIKNYLKYTNVEVVRITRTPLTRFTGRVALTLSTTGSSFTIRSLPLRAALRLRHHLLAMVCPASA